MPQDLVHRLALGQFVDQFVEIANLAHGGLLDILDANPADDAVISARAGLSFGARAKKSSKLVLFSSSVASVDGVWPVSHKMTSSTSTRLRPLRSALAT